MLLCSQVTACNTLGGGANCSPPTLCLSNNTDLHRLAAKQAPRDTIDVETRRLGDTYARHLNSDIFPSLCQKDDTTRTKLNRDCTCPTVARTHTHINF